MIADLVEAGIDIQKDEMVRADRDTLLQPAEGFFDVSESGGDGRQIVGLHESLLGLADQFIKACPGLIQLACGGGWESATAC